jgi:hypothetical protein
MDNIKAINAANFSAMDRHPHINFKELVKIPKKHAKVLGATKQEYQQPTWVLVVKCRPSDIDEITDSPKPSGMHVETYFSEQPK